MCWLFKNTNSYSQVGNFTFSSILYCDNFTSFHSVISRSVNEVGIQTFKRWFARRFYFHRLTLAEVEPSNGLGSCLANIGHHFRLIVFHAMPEVTTFWKDAPIQFAPCRWHQAKPGWQAITTDGSSSSLPQREAAGFHFAPLSCFSQCQWGWKTYLQMMTCSMALPNAGWRLRK